MSGGVSYLSGSDYGLLPEYAGTEHCHLQRNKKENQTSFLFKLTLILSPLILEIMFFNDQEYLICYSLPCTCM